MCPMCYWEMIRQMRDPVNYRFEMVRWARERGVSEAARRFETTRVTVRKWLRRFEEEGRGGLRDRSRAPLRSPHRVEVVERILRYRRRRRTFGPRRIQLDLGVPHSTRTIWRVLREAGEIRPRRIRRYQKTYGQ